MGKSKTRDEIKTKKENKLLKKLNRVKKTKGKKESLNKREEQLMKKLAKLKRAEEARPPRVKNKEKYNNRKPGEEKKTKKNKKKNRKPETFSKQPTPGTEPVSDRPTPDTEPVSEKPSGAGWNNWSEAEFESEERKNKFLRFMGVKKTDGGKGAGETAGGSSSKFDSAISKDYGKKIEKDLEKQFSAGVAKRQQTQRGGRGGLGF